MIRRASGEDIPDLVAMGREFHAMSPHSRMAQYDPAGVSRMLSFLIGRGLVLTNDEGVIGGMMAPVYFDPGKFIMEESFWWARKGGRDLLKAFCEEARIMGADFVSLSTLENEKQHAIDRVVRKMGFEPLERRYLRAL